VKDEVYAVAARLGLAVVVVANQRLNVPTDLGVEMIVVPGGPDAADDWIAEEIRAGDIVVTADIPLAARCLAVGAFALGTHGRELTGDSIGGALATRDWRPMHHDKDFAVERNGVKNIFLNTPNQAAWFERYISDWTGPKGRLGRIRFRMRDSIFPGDRMVFSGEVTGTGTDERGVAWVDLKLAVSVGERVCTDCDARVALPADASDNPWRRKGDDWQP